MEEFHGIVFADILDCIKLKITPFLPLLSNSAYLYSLSLELTARLGMCPLKTRYQEQEVKAKATKTGVTEKTRHYHCNDTFCEISYAAALKLFQN